MRDVKALRLLSAGRVDVLEAGHKVTARVAGDHDVYLVARRRGHWTCSCPANTQYRRTWSHMLAAALVVAPHRGTGGHP